MSGIYIANRELPKSCRVCFVNISTPAFPSCSLAKDYAAGKELVVDGLGNNIRPTGCPLVEIPPHGRCVDADALREDWLENGENEYVYDTNSFLYSIDDAPTVIEADKEDSK